MKTETRGIIVLAKENDYLLFIECRVSVWEDKKASGTDVGDGCTTKMHAFKATQVLKNG